MINRKKGLEMLAKSIKDGAIFSLAEKPKINVVSTGIATLDSALGVGGFVRGSQNILWGTPSSGKSALCYTAIGNLMKKDPEARACIFDIERSVTEDWLVKFGVDPERVMIVEEPTIEENVNTFQKVMRSCCFDFVVVDSLGAVIRATAFDGKNGDGGDANKTLVAGSSGVITQWVNKANSEFIVLDKMEAAGEEVIKPVLIFINQVRDNFNSMYGGHSMPGGHALQHMANVIIKITASGAAADKIQGTVNGEKQIVGTRVNCKIEKNKYAPKERMAGYNFCFEDCQEHSFGIDSVAACFDLAVKYGVIESRGAWCFYKTEGEKGFVKANGKTQMLSLLRENPEFYETVYTETMSEISSENKQLNKELNGN